MWSTSLVLTITGWYVLYFSYHLDEYYCRLGQKADQIEPWVAYEPCIVNWVNQPFFMWILLRLLQAAFYVGGNVLNFLAIMCWRGHFN